MPRYLISFADGTMNLSPDELAQAAVDSHAVVDEAKKAGAWIFGGGIDSGVVSGVKVTTDGQSVALTDPGRRPPVGGSRRRSRLVRGGVRVGCQDRRRLPLRPGGVGADARRRDVRTRGRHLPGGDDPTSSG